MAEGIKEIPELANFNLNKETFLQQYSYFKEATDIFYLICKTKANLKILSEQDCLQVIKFCEMTRFASVKVLNLLRKQREVVEFKNQVGSG